MMTPQEQEDARQRIAELERERDRALDERRAWMEKVTIDRGEIAQLKERLRAKELPGHLTLNLINCKDLDYICELAQGYFEINYGLAKEKEWLKRILRYRALFQEQFKNL